MEAQNLPSFGVYFVDRKLTNEPL